MTTHNDNLGYEPIGAAAARKFEPGSAAQCPKRFMRMTIDVVPSTPELQQTSAIPLGVVIHPLALPLDASDDIPLVDFSSSSIVRCRGCGAYINPFVHWLDGGRRFRCNICLLANDVPTNYVCGLRDGERTDLDRRPELRCGLVEFMASPEYTVRPPMAPAYFFLIDVSSAAVSSGALQSAVRGIKKSLDCIRNTQRAKIGIITFDSAVHFYTFKPDCTQAEMSVMPDIDDPFAPAKCDDLLKCLSDIDAPLVALLDELPEMHADNKQSTSDAFGAALMSAYHIMMRSGGRVLTFLSTLPTAGVGRLTNRSVGVEDVNTLLAPDAGDLGQFYQQLAIDCSKLQIAVDTYLFSGQFIDVATLGVLPQITGGELNHYPIFGGERDGQRLIDDIVRSIERETAWEGILRIRCSNGLSAEAHHGHFFMRAGNLLALPATDVDKAFAVQLKVHDLAGVPSVSVQASLLYTTTQGERRIRVMTQALPVVNQLQMLFKHADCEAIVNLTAKMAINPSFELIVADEREALVNKCVEILAVYRRNFVSPQTPSTQLVVPERLKSLPLYVMAMLESDAFRADVDADRRAGLMATLRVAPISWSSRFFHLVERMPSYDEFLVQLQKQVQSTLA